MPKKALLDIKVSKNSDIKVGNFVLRTFRPYVNRQMMPVFLGEILIANGFFDPKSMPSYFESTGDLMGSFPDAQGLDYYLDMTGGSIHVENYDMPRYLNMYYARVLGPGFFKRLLGVMHEQWIYPFGDNLAELGLAEFNVLGYRGCSPERAYMLRHTKPFISDIVDDGLFHLAPFVLLFRCSPRRLKHLFGKGLWKRLSANSRTRNNLILSVVLDGLERSFLNQDRAVKTKTLIDYIEQQKHTFGKGCADGDMCRLTGLLNDVSSGKGVERIVEIIGELAAIPSSYLNVIYQRLGDRELVDEVISGVKGDCGFNLELHKWTWPILKSRKMLSTARSGKFNESRNVLWDIYGDTLSMCEQLGESFNTSWSLNRMKSEHDRLSKLLMAHDYSDEPYKHADILPASFVFDTGDGKAVATFIDSPYKVSLLGSEHNNCLAGFANRLNDPKNLLFRIVFGNTESACYLVLKKSKWHVSQHYHPYNQRVGQQFKEIEDLLVDELDAHCDTLNMFEVESIPPKAMPSVYLRYDPNPEPCPF